MHVSFLSSSSLTQSFALRLMCVCGLHLKHQLAILSTHCQVVFRVQTFKSVSLNSPTEEEGFFNMFLWFDFNVFLQFVSAFSKDFQLCTVCYDMQLVSILIFYILGIVLSELRSAWKGCCQVHFKPRQW